MNNDIVIDSSRLREPTIHEFKQICKWFKAYYQKAMLLAILFGSLLCLLGAVLFVMYKFTSFGAALLWTICIVVGLFSAVTGVRTNKRVKQYFNLEFRVMDGEIGEIEGTRIDEGYSKVHFKSNDGEDMGVFNVSFETLKKGAKAILVYLPTDSGLFSSCNVFTHWMLTDAGIKNHF